ncbi:MAG: hypothetical protein AAFN91_05825 [Pseudomonadota bacterium]
MMSHGHVLRQFEQRIRLFRTADDVTWLALICLFLAMGLALTPYAGFTGTAEVPKELIPLFERDNYQGFSRSPPGLLMHMPSQVLGLATFILCGMAFGAALRRRWVFFFGSLMLLLAPAFLFGEAKNTSLGVCTVIACGAGLAKAVTRKQIRLAIIIASLFFALNASNHVISERIKTNNQNASLDLGDREGLTRAEFMRRIADTVSSLKPHQQAAGHYLTAQILHQYEDTEGLAMTTERLRPRWFTNSIFTETRIKTLRSAASPSESTFNMSTSSLPDFALLAMALMLIATGTFTARVRKRRDRVSSMIDQIEAYQRTVT